jgi:hypothetical protein
MKHKGWRHDRNGFGLLVIVLLGLSFFASAQGAVPYKATPQTPPYLEFKPYNQPAGFREFDLWWVEEECLRRTPPLIAPDFSAYVYGESLFMPDTRQTFSTLYWVPLPASLRGGDSSSLEASTPPSYLSYFDETAMLQRRKAFLKVNQDSQKSFSFETLTPVDWTPNSQRLLFKRRSGLLYTGLRASDVLVWDAKTGGISLYQELLRALAYHFITLGQGKGLSPRLEAMAWDIEPLGWQEGSNDVFYWRAWAYTNYPEKARLPLGLWSYNVALKETRLLDLGDSALPKDVAENGWVPTLNESAYPKGYRQKLEGDQRPFMQRPKQRQIFF